MKVKPVAVPVKATLEDLYMGNLLKVTASRLRICVKCAGKGGENAKKCDKCKGRGMIAKLVEVAPGMVI